MRLFEWYRHYGATDGIEFFFGRMPRLVIDMYRNLLVHARACLCVCLEVDGDKKQCDRYVYEVPMVEVLLAARNVRRVEVATEAS